MSSHKLHNYLRTHRKKVGFSQKDIAFLVGCEHVGKISRYESCKQIPHLTTVIAYEVIFRTPSHALFQGIFETIESDIRVRAKRLLRQKTGDVTCSNARRHKIICEHLHRLTKSQRSSYFNN
jgi:transcriptional regulator with XRE-family HTH domain